MRAGTADWFASLGIPAIFGFLAIAVAVVLMIGGAGRFSIDRAITKHIDNRPAR
jgi:uncharacterized membrane protein YphA (DoxX/SURF4 family)